MHALHMEQITYRERERHLLNAMHTHTLTHLHLNLIKCTRIYGYVACVCLHICFVSNTNLFHNRKIYLILVFVVLLS